jgi:hypothetical protein
MVRIVQPGVFGIRLSRDKRRGALPRGLYTAGKRSGFGNIAVTGFVVSPLISVAACCHLNCAHEQTIRHER